MRVADRRRNAEREMAKLAKKGKAVLPVRIEGRTIARSFWGNAWCENLESYSDFANRLPRGRTYVRNGSVVHLDIQPGKIEAVVSGSELYRVNIQINPAVKKKWQALCLECGGAIGSLIELLQGRFSDHVMEILTRKATGLFPAPEEIQMKCSCPDWATMCKHVAAVLYGVGARLDQSPELLFKLRSVNHEDLIAQAASAGGLVGKADTMAGEIAESELGAVFGIEMDQSGVTPAAAETKTTVKAKAKAKAKPKAAGGKKPRQKVKRLPQKPQRKPKNVSLP